MLVKIWKDKLDCPKYVPKLDHVLEVFPPFLVKRNSDQCEEFLFGGELFWTVQKTLTCKIKNIPNIKVTCSKQMN